MMLVQSLADEAEDGKGFLLEMLEEIAAVLVIVTYWFVEEAGSSFEDGVGATFGALVLITLFMSLSIDNMLWSTRN